MIPCPSCERKSECLRDRRCNRPSGVDVALREVKEAAGVLSAALKRMNEACAQLEAARAIEKGQQINNDRGTPWTPAPPSPRA